MTLVKKLDKHGITIVSQASPGESVSNASTGSGRSDCRVMASPWKGKLSTGVGGAILGKISFLVKNTIIEYIR